MTASRKRQGYLLAVGISAAVLTLRYVLSQPLGEQALLLPCVLAVIVAAGRGGLGPGLLATALCTVFGMFILVPPQFSFTVTALEHGAIVVMFVVIGVTVSLLCEALHVAQRRETEAQFRTLADSIPQLVWMARPDGYRFWFNRQWYDFTGAKPGESVGSGWQTAHTPELLPHVLESWKRAVETGEAWEDTHPLRRNDGQMRWFLSRAVPIHDERGDITCWFGTNTDIGDRMEAEAALREADRRKDDFLAMLAHELRNPLAPIAYGLELWPVIRDKPEELERLRTVMLQQVRQLGRLIDDLLDVSRIANGKIRLSCQPIDLRDALDRAIEENQLLIDARSQQLVVDTTAEPITVRGDMARLTQVFANVLNNAAKYTPPEGTIVVKARREASWAVVSVRDNGPGIPAHMLSRIFQMFEQVDNTLERAHGGLGIGLTLVRQLVELHGGSVEASSLGAGQGSEFTVRIPASVGALDPLQVSGSRPGRGADESPRRRILIVDDQQVTAETLAEVCRFLGHEASYVTNPAQAVAAIQRERPDVVLLDISMPGISGYELAERVRERDELAGVRLVALTGYGSEEDRQCAMQAGFDAHLVKPAGIDALQRLLTTLAQSPARARATAVRS